MLWKKKEKTEVFPYERVILLLGGSGVLGRAVLASRPPNTFIINISQSRSLEGDRVANFHIDLTQDPEKAIQQVRSFVPRVDVCVYAAYTRIFSRVIDLRKDQFLKEIDCDVYSAIATMRLCANYFWKSMSREENILHARKSILISSAAAFGKTLRPELASYSAAKAALNAFGPYLHDHLFTSYGVSVHTLAPGSLNELSAREKAIKRFWQIQSVPSSDYTIERIV